MYIRRTFTQKLSYFLKERYHYKNDYEEKLIWQDFKSKMIQEISLAKGTYQSVVESLIAHFKTVQ